MQQYMKKMILHWNHTAEKISNSFDPHCNSMNRLQARLGLTEFEAVKQMYDGVKKLIEMEKEAEKKGKWAELQPHRKSIAQINTD